MRTLQEKYNGVNEGAFSKDQFLRDARMQLPNLVTRFNGYDDAVQILKNRGVIQENISEVAVSQEAYIIHRITGAGQDAVQNFIDDNGLDGEKLAAYVKQHSNDKEKYDVRDIIAGTGVGEVEGYRNRFIQQFKQGTVAEEKKRDPEAELMDRLDRLSPKQIMQLVGLLGKDALDRFIKFLDKNKPESLKEARITNKSLPDYRYKVTNDMDKYPYEQILRGLRVELEGLKVTGTPTAEEYKKALAKVLKNLEKDEIYYTNQVAGISKKVDLHDKMVDVKKDNAVDTFNGLKKAQLKEGFKKLIKNILKENSEISGLYGDEEKYEREEKYGSYEEEDVYEMYGDSDGDYEHDKASGAEADRLYDAGYIYFLKGEGKKAEALRQEALKKGSWLGWGELEFPPYTTKDGSDVADDIRHPAGHLNHDDTIFESDRESDDDKLARYEKYKYTLDGEVVEPEIAFFDHYIGAELDGRVYRVGSPDETGTVELRSHKGKTGMYTENTFETVSLKDIL